MSTSGKFPVWLISWVFFWRRETSFCTYKYFPSCKWGGGGVVNKWINGLPLSMSPGQREPSHTDVPGPDSMAGCSCPFFFFFFFKHQARDARARQGLQTHRKVLAPLWDCLCPPGWTSSGPAVSVSFMDCSLFPGRHRSRYGRFTRVPK